LRQRNIIIAAIVIGAVIGVAAYVIPLLSPDKALYEEGNSLAAKGEYAAAIEKYLTLMQKYPDSEYATVYRIHPLLAECYFNWADKLVNESKYSEAIDKYDMVKEYPGSGIYDEAIDAMGECYYKWGQSLRNQNNFADSIEKYELGQRDAANEKCRKAIGEVYYEWGGILRSQKGYTKAIEKYQMSIDSYYSEYKVQSREAISECFREWITDLVAIHDYDNAIETYVMVVENYTTSESVWDWARSEEVDVLSDIPDNVLFTWAKRLQQEESYYGAIGLYGTLLRYYPESQYTSEAEKAKIDTEIAQISAGQHGYLPPAIPQNPEELEGKAELTIINDTSYKLTVLLSGPTTRSVILSAGGTEQITLDPGVYEIAAKVSAEDVIPYYGETTFEGNYLYENRFYISTSY
jgi:tetratricopeptide (TPR) repeat protein